jgi:hypothetical protein
MVVRKKNLLDAFRAASPEGRKAAPPSSPSSSGAGGPFAPSSPHAPERPVTPRFDAPRRSSALGRALADRSVRGILLVAVVVVVAAWFHGRWSAKPAEAASSSARESAGPGVLARPGGGAPVVGAGAGADADLAQLNLSAARMGTADDQAFMDPANKYTVRLIQYDNDTDGLKRARDMVEFLRKKEGLPIVGPISIGKKLILAAGHAARIDQLEGLLGHVKALRGPPPQDKKLPFATAYVVNIDDVVKRR